MCFEKGRKPYFHRNNEDNFKKQQERDKLKQELCFKHKIDLIIVPYWIIDKEKYIEDEYHKLSTS